MDRKKIALIALDPRAGRSYQQDVGRLFGGVADIVMGLGVIMLANLFLVQVNSSDRDFAYHSVRRLIKDGVMWAVNLGTLALLGVILYSPLSVYLKLAPLSAGQLLTAFGLAGASVLWYEGVKLVKKWCRGTKKERSAP